MPRTAVILQSNYIPWKGYFDLINSAGVFVIYDEVQFTRRDWRNRNKIILNGKSHWLTIPVETKGKYELPINQIKVSDHQWAKKHWATIRHAYGKAEHFASYEAQLAKAYEEAAKLDYLTDINILFLELLSDFLDITHKLVHSRKIPETATDPTGRLVEICQKLEAQRYISGPSAKAYIEKEQFESARIELCYANYADYPQYKQTSETFEHGVSILDLLMHEGRGARQHLKSVSNSNGLISP
jgi:hypothetical protein